MCALSPVHITIYIYIYIYIYIHTYIVCVCSNTGIITAVVDYTMDIVCYYTHTLTIYRPIAFIVGLW